MPVSIAIKNLFESRIRFFMSVGGVALAMLLILVLDGVSAGSIKQVVAYMENIDYQIMVSQKGVKNMHMTTSFFEDSEADKIESVDGVESVNPVLYTSDYLVKGSNRSVAYVIGFKSGKLGGPWVMSDGDTRLKKDEIIIDERIADKYDLKIGDTLTVLGRSFKIGGLTRDTVNIINSIAFIRFDDFQRIRNTPGAVSYALVTVKKGQNVNSVIENIKEKISGVSVLTREGFSSSEQKAVSDMSIDIIRLMNLIGFLIGLAALGLTVYTSTLSKLREYGILKAIGSKNRRLMGIVFQQSLISTVVGLAIAIAVAYLVAAGLVVAKVNVLLVIQIQSVLKVLIGAAVVNVLAASIPILRIAGLNPADVFRRQL